MEYKQYLAEIGKKGGQARTPAKIAASKRNIALASAILADKRHAEKVHAEKKADFYSEE